MIQDFISIYFRKWFYIPEV